MKEFYGETVEADITAAGACSSSNRAGQAAEDGEDNYEVFLFMCCMITAKINNVTVTEKRMHQINA
jgi:hypothetical protein